MANEVIRVKAKEKGVRLWQIAARLGISDNEFSRRLRFELSDQSKNEALRIVDEIAQEAELNENKSN